MKGLKSRRVQQSGSAVVQDDALVLARALIRALKATSPEAFIQGDPENGEKTIVDGRFDLRAVAKRVARYSARSRAPLSQEP